MDSNPQPLPTSVNVNHVRALRAVVERGSLSGAAKELGYTTSAISQQISSLERDLGASLFERGPRSVRVTAAGEHLYDISAGLLENIASIADVMRGYASAEQGILKLTASGSGAAQLLPRAVAGISSVHPEATIALVAPGAQDDIVESVRSGIADIGIVYHYSELPEPEFDGLDRTTLLSEEMVVIGREQGPSGEYESLSEFAEEVWLCGSRGSTQDQVLNQVAEHAGFAPQIRHRSDDLDVIRGLVNQGLGIALVPVLSLGIDRSIRLYRLRQVPTHRSVHLVYRATDRNPLIASALASFRAAADDYLVWSRTAFEVNFATPMLCAGDELQRI